MLRAAYWPNLLVALAFLGAVVSAVMLAPLLRERLTGRRSSTELHTGAFETFKLLGQLVAVFLTFLLIQSMGYFREAEIAVAREAGDITQLDRALAGSESEAGQVGRERLLAYTRAVIEREWPAIRSGRTEPATAEALRELQDATAAIPAASRTFALVQKSLGDVEDDRTVRLGAGVGSLPGALWGIAGALLALLVGTAAFLIPGHGATTTMGFYAAGLALLAALLFMAEGPYRGEFSVRPAPLERALAAMSAR